jgi:hypothetical protein
MTQEDIFKRLEETFGSREAMLGHQLIQHSTFGWPCDVTFFKRKPIINVRVGQQLGLAIMYGAGARKLQEMLERIEFSDGAVASFNEIWTVNPMPKDGFSDEELSAVDLAEAEEKVGPNGETLRKMIRDTYHCDTVKEEDKYLRRFIAS